ncbi:hypothetical protein A6R70_14690 [Agrobacterium rubi]|uniref:hypothetical protein n=1 Tax=Agrobacterium rubi TaxID=28099 RepID=UPI00201B5743|nr:hypothetical protein [Agrobacterium rubi]MCL6653536.1 hypothetical protein [Agrobacterium rubi]
MTADTITAIKKNIEDEIERVVQSVNEWDDRTSPDDYPEHLLITSEELADILRNFADVTLESLQRENEGLRNLADRLKLEAQGHAMEARGANSTIAEIYQIISGARGEPGNWNGAEPVRRYVSQLMIDASNHAADAETVRREREVERQRADSAEAEVNRLRERLDIGPQGEDAIDVAESCEGFLRHRILTAEAEMSRIKDVIGVEILPRLHLTRVFAGDMTERNWADKKDYIIQQVDWSLIAATALSSTGDTHGN